MYLLFINTHFTKTAQRAVFLCNLQIVSQTVCSPCLTTFVGGDAGIRPRITVILYHFVHKINSCSWTASQIFLASKLKKYSVTLRIPDKRYAGIFFVSAQENSTQKGAFSGRRRRDSNPGGLLDPASLAVRCFRPLSHVSLIFNCLVITFLLPEELLSINH